MKIFLKIRYHKCCVMIDLIQAKKLILLKVTAKNECMICHYWFFNHEFKFEDSVCNGCHDLSMLSVNVSDIAITNVKNVDYRCIIHKISKSEAINLLESTVLEYRGYI